MSKKVGIWIDHKQAYLMFVGEGVESLEHMESGMEKHVRYTGRTIEEDGAADDQRDSQYASHLSQYYDDVIGHLSEVKAILLFGPGEAKGEFKKRLAGKGMADRIVGVETVDKMTETEIAAKVRQHFHTSLPVQEVS